MNFLSEQLYQKNTLLKTYEKQNQRLKNIISKEKSLQYLKFPKDGSLTSKINDLEIENHNVKNKLNQTLMVNIELMNRAQKERMFNKKLQAENEILKRKIIQISQKLEALNGQNLVGNIERRVVDFSMLRDIVDAKGQSQILQKSNQKQSNTQQNDMVIRTLNMQKQKQQYLQEIEYLKGQLEMTKKELQRSQAEVSTLRQKILQLEENNRSGFVMEQNDKLQGSIAQMQLIRTMLQMGLSKAIGEKERGQREIQMLRELARKQIHSLTTQNDTLRRSYQKQSMRKDTVQELLNNSGRSNNGDKIRKYSQVSIKSHKSIKQSENTHSIRNYQLESQIEILVDSERSDVKHVETKENQTNDSKEVCRNKQRHSASYMDQNGMDYLKPPTKNKQQRQQLDMLKTDNLSTYPKSFQQYLTTKPVIKQTRVSFLLDDISEEGNWDHERERENNQKHSENNNVMDKSYQNSLMSNRTLKNELTKGANNQGQTTSSLWNQIKNVFAA